MPRNHHPSASTLRNRVRITNKTRLKIHHGSLEADALLIPDEDEEKHHLINLVAGVDAEDANEHHLQAVLSAAQRHNTHRPTRATDKSSQNAPPPAYIPTPDSTGVVDNYAELYSPDRWKDPATYLYSSSTVEESFRDGLSGGFSYTMDERDKEWLDKNNEEARGEGTSAQGAVSPSTTRTSARSAKAKGKEPEVSQQLVISEDEFELVMGLFEKVTHEKTEYLHHGLETGMAFPAFSEYQDTFSSPLQPPTFASYVIPAWIPPPANLIRIARAVYPYWKERRIERGGHRIIPILNFDESDAQNESYVCFRRREIKAIRKTRASQATSSDKLIRLQHELAYPLDLAKLVLLRETQKKEDIQHVQQVWERRLGLADLKRKHPSLGDKGDEELLVDKEKPKKSEISRVAKLRTESGTSARPEVAMRPRERTSVIDEAIELALNRQKEQDHHWEDQIDNPYQPPLVPYSHRLFKYIPVNFTGAETDGKPILQRESRALRLRRGRGGRMLVDRRSATPRTIIPLKRSKSFSFEDSDLEMDGEDDEIARRITERWRFDVDDFPAFGPEGPEEQNRTLVDDYASKYLRHSMTLLLDSDQQNLMTDPSIPMTIDGRQQMVVPFRLGMPQPQMRRDAPRPMHPPQALQPPAPLPAPSVPSNGASISMQQQPKKMPPPTAVPQMQIRISSNGGIRPPSVIGNSSVSQSSPPNLAILPQHSPPVTNGINRAAINISHIDVAKPEVTANHPIVNGTAQVHQSDIPLPQDSKVNGANGSPTKQSSLHTVLPTNGYHLTPLANQTTGSGTMPNPAQFTFPTNMSVQQVQNLKSVLANGADFSALQSVARSLPAGYLHVPSGGNFNIQQLATGANMNIKLPAARQMQWTAGGPQKVGAVVNGVDGSASPSAGQVVPVRVPSANGTRPNGIRIGSNGQLSTHAISPHLQHSPSPISAAAALAQSQSPPHLPLTPTLTKASPSLQHQQPSNSKSGY